MVDSHVRALSKVTQILAGEDAIKTLLSNSSIDRSIKAQNTILKMFESLSEVNSSYKELYLLNDKIEGIYLNYVQPLLLISSYNEKNLKIRELNLCIDQTLASS